MNERQKKFVREYLKDLNASQAALRAGYSKNGAGQKGEALLKIVEIQRAVQSKLDKRAEKEDLDAQKVLAHIKRAVFTPMDKFITWSGGSVDLKDSTEIPPELQCLIEYIEENQNPTSHNIKFKLINRMKALELLTRHLGMLNDKLEVQGGKTPITVNVTPYPDAKADE
jgi:phage terminase small subunit